MGRENVIQAIAQALEKLTNAQIADMHNELYDDTQIRYVEDDYFEVTGEAV